MSRNRSIIVGILVGFLVLTLSASLVLAQTEEVRTDNTKQAPPVSQTPTVSANAQTIAEFDAQIQQIRDNATQQIAELEAALQSRSRAEQETYFQQIEDVKKTAQISILEVRREQELARGNTELALKFQQASEMLRNPAPHQAHNPQTDQR